MILYDLNFCQAQLQLVISVEIELSLALMSIPQHHQWKMTSVEDDLNGRRTQWKTTSMEDDLNVRMQ